ncbi:hypothetical protein LVY72_02775 [Arthrobacter sp. I2-34]|uniref:Uncharacterized protein n=1 Tax=Arthrobacter hankyongi TaxID=2904801 RepID=A0ABS9L2U6_9MICC|nr:hypothetical protein [Arthrobacter hankyongi]MCG2620834.1 hypothetical protein [Arthrobacter hankyongi]
MTTEGNGQTESPDELLEDQAVHPRDPGNAAGADEETGEPLEAEGGPDSENVDGAAQARNAEESGGYGY